VSRFLAWPKVPYILRHQIQYTPPDVHQAHLSHKPVKGIVQQCLRQAIRDHLGTLYVHHFDGAISDFLEQPLVVYVECRRFVRRLVISSLRIRMVWVLSHLMVM